MNLLVYVTPWPENGLAVRGRSGFLSNWFKRFLNTYNEGLRAHSQDLSVRVLYPENRFLTEDTYPESFVKLVPIRLSEIDDIFPSHKTYMDVLTGNAPDEKKDQMLDYFQQKLEGYTPDIVIGLTPCHFFSEIWPEALCLVMEAGFFSRPPYPPTQYFDPADHISSIFPAAAKSEILAAASDNDVSELVEPVFRHFRKEILEGPSVSRQDLDPDNRFKSIILLPLQFEECPSFDHCCDFSDQRALLEHVVENLPHNVLLIVTKHQFTVMDDETLRALCDRPNTRFLNSVGDVRVHVSQRLLSLVDGVVTVSSSVGMQAAIWGKFCICIGRSHVRAFADSDTMDDLPELMEKMPGTEWKKRLIGYLFTHYYVPFEFLWEKPDWTQRYFEQKLSAHRAGIQKNSLEFHPRIASNTALREFYISE